jgi:hypothetical protein
MKTITLPRHYWWSFRAPATRRESGTIVAEVAVRETKPRAPSCDEERFWSVGKVRLLGIIMPNRFQTVFFAVLCTGLALPVFLFDESGHGIYHGFVTLGGLVVLAALCWTVGMLLASTASEDEKRRRGKGTRAAEPKEEGFFG